MPRVHCECIHCCVQVMDKYGSRAIYEHVGELFKAIPLCSVIEGRAFVVHAGIPSMPGTTMYHVGAVGRKGLAATVASQWDGRDSQTGKRRVRPRSLSIVEDMLWSDPVAPEEGPSLDDMCEPNLMRGAGVVYGPKMVREWLKAIGVPYMVRSHQVRASVIMQKNVMR